MTKAATTSIIFAILSLVGSCQPAVLIAGQTTAAAIQSDRTFSIGPVATTAPATASFYITSPAAAMFTNSHLNFR